MWIKLKISKNHSTGFREKDLMYNNKRVCRFCNKVFSSGKALGGHTRIHFQANKLFKKQQYAPENDDRVIDLLKKKQTCIICGRDFPSEKSLFGHMRCHPERDWRGIQSPTMARNSSSSSSSSDNETRKMDDQIIDNQVDLTKSLKGWSVTAKRGRNKVMVASILKDDQLLDAVNDLMMLQKGDESDAENSTSMNSKGGIRGISPVFKPKEERIIGELGSSNLENLEYLQVKSLTDADEARTGLILEKPVVEFERKDCVDDEKKCLETISYGNVTIKNKKRRKKMKLSDLELVQNADPKLAQQPNYKYYCSTCDKSFTTHQALGGHRSRHKKTKIWVHEEISNPIVELADEAEESEASNICRRVLDFDLNEVPIES